MAAERLQKIIAAAGLASRRKAEELITSGHVSVNGKTVSELGAKADPAKDEVRVNGQRIRPPKQHTYILLHKPKGYVTTVSDPEGRPTVMTLIRKVRARVYPVGRLDFNSEGLLLLTDDGELANQLTRAASNVPKTYLVKVAGKPTPEELTRLRSGVVIRGPAPGVGRGIKKVQPRNMKPVRTAPAHIKLVREAENPWYEITIIEGRNRQIHRMFAEVGHYVEKIKRVKYATLELDVPAGEWRELTSDEVKRLKAATHPH